MRQWASHLILQIRDQAVFITRAEVCYYEIDEGLSGYRLGLGSSDGMTMEKVKELSAVFNARTAYDPDLKVLAIVCDEQKVFQRIGALLKTLDLNTEAGRDLKVLVVAGDGQTGSRRAEILLETLAEQTDKAVGKGR